MTSSLHQRGGVGGSLAAAVLLTAAADLLLFHAFWQPIGLALPLFLFALSLAVIICNQRTFSRLALLPLALLSIALLGLIEDVGTISVLVAIICLAKLAIVAAGRERRGLAAHPQILCFLACAPLRFWRDARRIRAAARRASRGMPKSQANGWLGWIMPLALAAVFIALFARANPIVKHWLAMIDLWSLIDPFRVAFWIIAFSLVWAFLRPRFRRPKAPSQPPSPRPPTPAVFPASVREAVLGHSAALRALLIFNSIFAVQTGLDAAYLWGSAVLPDGMTHAAYAHRGAYPLVATALLAAAFVLFVIRPTNSAAGDRRVRALVLLWTEQNVLLVLSSILRLDLYVDAYSLTGWRVAAFVWMGLVAVGLILIIVRIVFARSDRWLVQANLNGLVAVLLVCGFVDFPAIISTFNVTHSQELNGTGPALDVSYLASLGPGAIPAIDRYLIAVPSLAEMDPLPPGSSQSAAADKRLLLAESRCELVAIQDAISADWRSWTFRSWRLSRTLEKRESPTACYRVE